MLGFSQYLVEAAGKALSASVSGMKTKGHIKRYILPFLSSQQKKQSLLDLGNYFSEKDVQDSNQHSHGEQHDPKAKQTHFLSSKHGQHEKGTGVRVTGVYNDNGTIMARTANHGNMPISKLGTPEKLAGKQKSKHGLELEPRLQTSIDPSRKPAGSTKTAHDFSAGDTRNGGKAVRGKAVKGKEVAGEESLIRGEAKTTKADKPAMGTSELHYDPEKKNWAITNAGVSNQFSRATVNNEKTEGKPMSLLDYLNKHHADGNIDKGFSARANPGTTVEYLKNANSNALHLHRYKEDDNGNVTEEHGTTFTIGDNNPLKDKLGMAHLGEADLDRLDGSLRIEKSRPKRNGGSITTVKHNPNPTVYREYATHSTNNPETSIGIHNTEHGAKVRERLNSILDDADKRGIDHSVFTNNVFSNSTVADRAEETKRKRLTYKRPGTGRVPQTGSPIATAPRPGLNPEAEHSGRSFYTPQEKLHMKGLV